MKKVAVVWSSPNIDGLTASAGKQIMNGISGLLFGKEKK